MDLVQEAYTGTLIQRYRDSLKRIHTLDQDNDKFKEDKRKQTNELSWDYRDKIHALEKERNAKTETIETKYDELVRTNETLITFQRAHIHEVERIILLLSIKPAEVVWEDSAIIPRKKSWHGSNESDHYFIKPLDMIYSDQWLKIKAFILENKKPVNKYSLCLFGRCLFVGRDDTEKLLSYPNDGGIPGNQTGQQIAVNPKDFPTVKEATAYYERMKHSFLALFIEDYKKVKEEYQKIIGTWTLADFRPLFVYECKACGLILTHMTEGHWSRTADACPSCNITTAEANKIAGCSKKELPLYISEVWTTEAGKKFYERRMQEVLGR